MDNIIEAIIDGKIRVHSNPTEEELHQCYKNEHMVSSLYSGAMAMPYTRIIFFHGDAIPWTLDDHEIAFTVCSLLPEEYIQNEYLTPSHDYCQIYNQVFAYVKRNNQ
jgi:hypothetical protein